MPDAPSTPEILESPREESSGSPGGRRRRALRGLLALVLVLVLAWSAGAWYFAGQIHADALGVSAPEVPLRDVRVAGLDGNRVTLEVTSTAPDRLTAPGNWGLRWDGGYGQVGAVTGRDPQARPATITRQLTVFHGAPPAVGDRVEVDRAAFGDNPREVLLLPYRNVRYPGPLGAMPAWFVPGGDDTWAVMVHGRQARREEELRGLRIVAQMGLPALVISYRNDPGAPRDPSGLHQFGATEWKDVEAAVRYARSHGARDVVLVGYSMGGAISTSFLARSPLADEVTGLVLNGPLLDLETAIDVEAGRRRLPGTPLPLPPGLDETAAWVAEQRYGVDLDAFDQTDELVRADVPLLLFHATADEKAPVQVSDAVVAARGQRDEPTRYVRVEGAEHIGEWNADPRRYDAEMRQFLSRFAG